ncbi:GYF domain-containing protein [Haloferula rosea]|uniref:DUF4339 domain-containing protein n=1 Tax=Haloferula rosea TaxID=490093 RepID=A0A934REL4_9BACT|nr:GYF domain-containing protein [Haloferula rosea]MBK1827696.1 DUF4339 domain-containing protein [Haloferula rosea]
MAQWYYGLNGQQSGPVEDDEIRAMLASGMINGQTIVWREGMDEWLPILQVPEWSSQVVYQPPVAAGPAPVPGYGGIPVVPNNGMAIASMVCGISSLVLLFSCFIGILAGIPAVICGHLALKQIREYVLPMGGRGMAIAGLVTGYITIGITLAGGIFLLVAISRDM